MNEKKSKHLSLDDRIEIQECLNKEMSFNAIAKRILIPIETVEESTVAK